MPTSALNFEPGIFQPLAEEIMERSGQNLLACYQCRRCAAGCPVGDETEGVTPDRLIRMILLGEKAEALNNLLVWKCVACYTCGTRCPNDIQTARITETLKQMSKEGHIEPLTPKVAAFHDAFLTSTAHFGRVNELEFMGIYEMKTAKSELKRGGWKAILEEMMSQAKLGLSMMKNKRMHFGLDKVRGLPEVKALYTKSKEKARDRRNSADKI
ncbi:MAG TPA: 4Fe-4S dicluster domain-containing protein [Thermodesulfovibrionales bacterium]|nr:4Fe-4S dicluster domain-containing protein [Thermodesulfovibrionales bacterium]